MTSGDDDDAFWAAVVNAGWYSTGELIDFLSLRATRGFIVFEMGTYTHAIPVAKARACEMLRMNDAARIRAYIDDDRDVYLIARTAVGTHEP